MLVQYLVVLQAVEKRRRRRTRIAGKEYCRARDTRRRLLLEARDEVEKRNFQAPRLLEKDTAAASPAEHDQHQEDAERDREPAALE